MSKPFRFKQFQIHHDRCAMKVGTDGVLLGATAQADSPKRILDIGTGTGLVALMLAQRFPEAKIVGVEIDDSAFLQAKENVAQCPWADRIRVLHTAFQDFANTSEEKFDLIVSNPPYFQNHLQSMDSQRNLALHQESLNFGDLAAGISRLLANEGVFWVILPHQQMKIFESRVHTVGLTPYFLINICDRPSKSSHRQVQAFSFKNRANGEMSLSIRDYNGDYTKEYSDLLRDFLIIF